LRFSINVRTLRPVNITPSLGEENGFMKRAVKCILIVATRRMTSRPLLALENIELPAKQIAVQRTRRIVPHRYCHQKPSRRKLAILPEKTPKF
jgi:hypothetical protein